VPNRPTNRTGARTKRRNSVLLSLVSLLRSWGETIPWRRYITVKRCVGVVVIFGSFFTGLWFTRLYQDISLLIDQRKQGLSSAIYSAPLVVHPGDDLAQIHFFSRLHHLSYSEVAAVEHAGEYAIDRTKLTIFVRDFRIGDIAFPARKLILSLNGTRVDQIVDALGQVVDRVVLEPEVIGRMMSDAPAERVEVPLDELPPYLVKGLLVTEDRYFYYHFGFDPVRIVKAAFIDLRAGRAVAGASTITQQLARTFMGNRERSFARKMRELAIALVLEIRLSKKEILLRYINDVYMGEDHGRPVYGLPLAARYLFNKDLRNVTPAEAATLIGMIRAPILYDPRRHPNYAKQRRDTVLALMKRYGVIDASTAQMALNSPIEVATATKSRYAPYFVEYVISEVEQLVGPTAQLGGVKVYTTLDPELQEVAERAAKANLQRLEAHYPRLRRTKVTDRLETALVAIDARSGAIKAMVGGRDFRTSQFNRATMARRQVGSTIKPLVYLAALDPDRTPLDRPLTLASILPDRPMSFHGWAPADYERVYRGEVTVAEALARSLNIPAAYIGYELGPRTIVKTAHQMGMAGDLPEVPSIAIGAGEATLLELTSVYQVFAAGGELRVPYAIVSIVDGSGRVLFQHKPVERRLVRPSVAYLITAALQGVIRYGTAANALSLGLDFPAAGKTGTTNDYQDAYFVGYTPELVCGVWVGFDKPQSIGLTGAQAALPEWVDFMIHAWPASHRAFPVPKGVSFATIDLQTGELAVPACPRITTLPFLNGTAPTVACHLHSGAALIAGVPTKPQASATQQPPKAQEVTGQSVVPAPTATGGGIVATIKDFFRGLFGH